MNEQKFLVCNNCGNMVGVIRTSGVPMICCGEKMNMINANVFDASEEKHIPFVTVKGDKIIVSVGKVEHPMEDNHFIQWVYIQTEKGGMRHNFQPGEKPVWEFVTADKPVAVFAYCNLHGLWKIVL